MKLTNKTKMIKMIKTNRMTKIMNQIKDHLALIIFGKNSETVHNNNSPKSLQITRVNED